MKNKTETQINHSLSYPITIIGCGYLGKKVLQQLLTKNLAAKKNVSAIVKTQKSQQCCSTMGVKSIAIDFDDTDSIVSDAFKTRQALLYYFMPPPAQGQKDTRVKHFIQQLKQPQSPPPKKVVLISTTGVYGNCHGQWINEIRPLNPQFDRALRRVDAEQQFQSYCQEFNVPLVILRVSGIYGPDKLPLQRIKEKTPIVRQEDSPYSNRIHSDDLVTICIQAGLSETIKGIFNCADGHPTTMYDYFIKVARANNLPEPPVISLEQAETQLSAGMLSYMNESRRIDNSKLLEIFNMRLRYPDLDAGLKAISLKSHD